MTTRYVAIHTGALVCCLLYFIVNYKEALKRPECTVALYKTDTSIHPHYKIFLTQNSVICK